MKADLSLGKGKSAIVVMWPINRQAEDSANAAESLVITGRNAVIKTGKGTLNFPPVLDYTSTSIAWDGDTAQHFHFTFKSRLLLNRLLIQQGGLKPGSDRRPDRRGFAAGIGTDGAAPSIFKRRCCAIPSLILSIIGR